MTASSMHQAACAPHGPPPRTLQDSSVSVSGREVDCGSPITPNLWYYGHKEPSTQCRYYIIRPH